jgi:hypothetical protein
MFEGVIQMNNRCIFSYNSRWCAFTVSAFSSGIECNGESDKRRCPFWAIADALNRIEAAIERLEVRE